MPDVSHPLPALPTGSPELLFHGSPKPGLAVLEPSRCVVDPADWAGVDAQGHKVLQSVVWLTPERTAAVVFALKHLAEDLVLDVRHQLIYFVRSTPLPEDAQGWVYTVRRTDSMRQIRGVEWYAPDPTAVVDAQRVTPADLAPMVLRVVAELPAPP